jgi:hypothetical protein
MKDVDRSGDSLSPDRSDSISGDRLSPHLREPIRLELEETDDRIVVHNYGHGGAGVTLSWTCAVVVAKQMTQRLGLSVDGLDLPVEDWLGALQRLIRGLLQEAP